MPGHFEPLTPRQKMVKLAFLRFLARRELFRRRLRLDPKAFAEYAFESESGDPLKLAWFHREWHDLMSGNVDCIIIAPRGHGKTSTIISRIVWELGNNTNLRIKIVCQSDSMAKGRLFEVQQNIEGNPRVKFVFPGLMAAAKGEWSKHKMYVRRTIVARDASVHALGILSTATGGRSDLNVYDDVVDRRNAILQPKQRENVKMSYKGDFSNLLLPGGRTWYIATKWHKDDLTHELLRNKRGIYAIREYAIDENLTPLWPAVWNHEALVRQRKKIGKVEFDRGFRNIALSGDVIVIQPEWIKYRPLRHFPDDMHVVCAYDLAIEDKTRSDYFAWSILGWSPGERKIFVIGAGHARLSFFQQIRKVVGDWLKWKARRVVVETIGYQKALAQELDRMTMIPVYGFKPQTNKGSRLLEVSPYIETGNVIFAEHLDPAADKVTQEGGDLVSELTEFPLYVTDDCMDAFTEGVLCVVDVYGGSILEDVLRDYDDEDDFWFDWEDEGGGEVGVMVAGGDEW